MKYLIAKDLSKTGMVTESELKKQTDKFSRQYKLVESKNENTQKKKIYTKLRRYY